ncbi:MFS transporter [Bacillus massiliigorillae]|uniref:MFS transporter n=1 Tax=Bacillus massiliigorillae TaxID=1243664 RepID=UPI0003A40D34|nr:MFS transporter [Bacillus massiliigorillae]
MNKDTLRFWILVSIVGISGFSQGILMPLIAIIFESDGVSSSMNGLHATGLYIGVLFVAPLMEAPLRRFGYKPLIIVGVGAVAIAFALFPMWKSFWFWFFLRLIIGIGDHMLHFSTQTWITDASPLHKRGRNISIYGLFFSLGFAFGPLMARLVQVNEALPFIISSAVTVIAWLTVLLLKNERPEQSTETESIFSTFSRFKDVLRYAWIALLPPLGFGILEASLNGSFPVYALRNDINIDAVSIILPAFSIGAIIFQIPLGMISDTYGRRKVLKIVIPLGGIIFTTAAIIQDSAIGLFICFILGGMIVGSLFSLGITYMADLLPKDLLPAGNLLCGMFFSFGSMVGPFIGGLVIEHFDGGSLFYLLSFVLFIVFFALLSFKPKKKHSHDFAL